jgi:hypothetical protein
LFQSEFGLVAEQVERVNPDLVARDDQGKAYTVRYEAVNAMLLNEFLKEHRKVETQEATIAQIRSTVAKQDTARSSLRSQSLPVSCQCRGVGGIVRVPGIDLNVVCAKGSAGIKRLRECAAEIVVTEALRGSEEL